MVNLECRMYENVYPEPDEIVMAMVTDIQEMGAYVELLEYNKCQGMIMLSELSRRRIRSVNKLVRVGRQEVVAVIRVDKEKGYIDLSKRRVAAEDVLRMEDKWNKARTVHSIMRHIAETVGVDLEDLYTRWGWPMYRKWGHAFEGFQVAVTDPEKAFEGIDIPENELHELLTNVKRKLTTQAIKFRAEFEVVCHSFDGIDAIKEALRIAENSAPEEAQVKVKIVAAPLYIMGATSLQKTQGMKALSDALKIAEKEITERGGRFSIKSEPRPVSDRDEKLLSNLMKEAEKENLEGNEDDDDEDSDEDDEKEDKEDKDEDKDESD